MSARPTALFLSPHLDDAVFSCGGTAARLSRCGWRVVVATAFTASVPEPEGFALACLTDKGIPPETDYMALRRAEDEKSVSKVGGDPLWLDLPEAPHRGYESAHQLFAGTAAGDLAHEELARLLGELVQGFSPRLIFSPQALGRHVDHLQMLGAVRSLQAAHEELQSRVLYYRDTPYAIWEQPARREPTQLIELAIGVERDLEVKLDACAAYTTQLGFQFGNEDQMRNRLERFAEKEGWRLDLGVPAEAYLGTGEVRTFLSRLPDRV